MDSAYRAGALVSAGAARGRVVVITGASSGIGRCTAVLFGRAGWGVGLIARGQPGLASIHRELSGLGVRSAACAADVSAGLELEAAAAFVEGELGPMDLWVNCAGNGVYGRFLGVPEAEFRRVNDVTYLGTVNGTRTALARMVPRDSGQVVNVCSAIAFHGLPMLSSYSGAKQAVRGFTDSVRHELIHERSRVRMTIVYPPAVNTPFFSHAVSHMAKPPRPAKPVYQPEVVAHAIMLAAESGRREIKISGVTVVFALACKFLPGIVHLAIQRLGSAGQMTDSLEAARLRDPTMFTPSLTASGAHGPFDGESRRYSLQMWASRHRLAFIASGIVVVAAVAGAIMRYR